MSSMVDLFEDTQSELSLPSPSSSSPPTVPSSPSRSSKRKSLKPKKRSSYQDCKRASVLVRTKKKNPESKRKTRPGTVARREIRYYQNESGLLMPKMPFRRIVRDVAAEVATIGSNVRFTSEALDALQSAAEGYLTKMLEMGNFFAVQNKRSTLLPRDVQLSSKMDAHYTNIFHFERRGAPRIVHEYKVPPKSQSAPKGKKDIQDAQTSSSEPTPSSATSDECQKSISPATDERGESEI